MAWTALMGTHREHREANPQPENNVQVTGLQLANRRTYAPDQRPFPLTSIFIRSKKEVAWISKGRGVWPNLSHTLPQRLRGLWDTSPLPTEGGGGPGPGDFQLCGLFGQPWLFGLK